MPVSPHEFSRLMATARDIVDEFHRMVTAMTPAPLGDWITRASASMLAAFGRGIAADQPAVHAALTEPWSNGPTEGHITRLKLIRRQMYGRSKLDLLRASMVTSPARNKRQSPFSTPIDNTVNKYRL